MLLLITLVFPLSASVAPQTLSVEGTTACYERDNGRICKEAATVYAKLQPDAAVAQSFIIDGGNAPEWQLLLEVARLPSELRAIILVLSMDVLIM